MCWRVWISLNSHNSIKSPKWIMTIWNQNKPEQSTFVCRKSNERTFPLLAQSLLLSVCWSLCLLLSLSLYSLNECNFWSVPRSNQAIIHSLALNQSNECTEIEFWFRFKWFSAQPWHASIQKSFFLIFTYPKLSTVVSFYFEVFSFSCGTRKLKNNNNVVARTFLVDENCWTSFGFIYYITKLKQKSQQTQMYAQNFISFTLAKLIFVRHILVIWFEFSRMNGKVENSWCICNMQCMHAIFSFLSKDDEKNENRPRFIPTFANRNLTWVFDMISKQIASQLRKQNFNQNHKIHLKFD